jgi:alkylhydroperoxidase family enzyme
MALRFADRMTGPTPLIDPAFHDELLRHFTEDQILDLGMTVTFASGWQRFIEAFGIVPDRWADGAPPPFRALGDDLR